MIKRNGERISESLGDMKRVGHNSIALISLKKRLINLSNNSIVSSVMAITSRDNNGMPPRGSHLDDTRCFGSDGWIFREAPQQVRRHFQNDFSEMIFQMFWWLDWDCHWEAWGRLIRCYDRTVSSWETLMIRYATYRHGRPMRGVWWPDSVRCVCPIITRLIRPDRCVSWGAFAHHAAYGIDNHRMVHDRVRL